MTDIEKGSLTDNCSSTSNVLELNFLTIKISNSRMNSFSFSCLPFRELGPPIYGFAITRAAVSLAEKSELQCLVEFFKAMKNLNNQPLFDQMHNRSNGRIGVKHIRFLAGLLLCRAFSHDSPQVIIGTDSTVTNKSIYL